MDRLLRLRTPLAVAALAAVTLVVAARLGLGLSELGPDGSRAVAAARLAPNASDGSLTVLAAVLVASCFLAPATPARRGLALWGAVLTGLSLVATVSALSLTSVEVAGWSLVWLVPEVAVPVVAGVGLVTLAGRPAEGSARTSAGAAAAVTATGGPDGSEDQEPEEASPDPDLQPGWSHDAAAGAVWRTAGDAARGAPASGWGSTQDGWPAGEGSEDAEPTDRAPGSGWSPSQAWGRPPELPAAPDEAAGR